MKAVKIQTRNKEVYLLLSRLLVNDVLKVGASHLKKLKTLEKRGLINIDSATGKVSKVKKFHIYHF